MRNYTVVFCLLLLSTSLASGCLPSDDEGESNSTDSGQVQDTVELDSDSEPDSTQADSSNEPDSSEDTGSDPQVPFPSCLTACTTAADCGQSGTPAFDENNYRCDDGACVYRGCETDAECHEQFSSDFRCYQDSSIATCRQTCSTPADCAFPDALSHQEDNYLCSNGVCTWMGCNNDDDCAGGQSGEFRCFDARDLPNADVPTCRKVCDTASDCAQATELYGEDNYECRNGGCVWTGCNSTAECEGMLNTDLICR